LSRIKHAQLKKDSAKSCFQFQSFQKRKATAAFSTRRFHMNFPEGGHDSVVIAHRKHFCQLVGVPFDKLVCLEQVHGGNIVRLSGADAGRGARSAENMVQASDGVLTDSRDVVLSIRTADCAPLFFVDPVHHAIGMAHVGWRGASERLASKMVQAFRVQFLTKPSDLVVGIGPAIRPCCYEVGTEFKDVFGSFVAKRSKRLFFDLPQWTVDDLIAEGVEPDKIFDSGYCTACMNDKFPSFRREGERVSHMLSVLKLN
jgi:polyphenol oxidase